MEGFKKFFYVLAYFEYSQIWLLLFMDDCHLNNITKLEKINYVSHYKVCFRMLSCLECKESVH
jgi:hypothetical protein